jgi:hypothetical protein
VSEADKGLWASWGPVSLSFLLGQLVVCVVWVVPDWSFRHLGEPAYVGILGDATVVALLLLSRALPAPRLERGALAVFLSLMPAVYLAAWGVTEHGTWVWIEIMGLTVFATLAILGLLISPWYLGLGIIAHGVLWDLWHHERVVAQHFIPSWYTSACLIADVGVGIYACLRIRSWTTE